MAVGSSNIVVGLAFLLISGCSQQSKPALKSQSIDKVSIRSTPSKKVNDDSIYGIYYNNDNLPKNRRFGKNYIFNECDTEIKRIKIDKDTIKLFSSYDSIGFKYKVFKKVNYKDFKRYLLIFGINEDCHFMNLEKNGNILAIDPCNFHSNPIEFRKRM